MRHFWHILLLHAIIGAQQSDFAISASFQQMHGNTLEPLGSFQKPTKAQVSYSTCDSELLAPYQSVRHFTHILSDHQFFICNDHKPLIYAFIQRADNVIPRQLCHLDYTVQFATDIYYIPDSINIPPDASHNATISLASTVTLQEVTANMSIYEELQQLSTSLLLL